MNVGRIDAGEISSPGGGATANVVGVTAGAGAADPDVAPDGTGDADVFDVILVTPRRLSVVIAGTMRDAFPSFEIDSEGESDG